MNVLIVDDEILVRKSLERAFLRAGHKVDTAENGKMGLDLWLAKKPDLIMLDVLMPEMNGPDVIRELGSNKTGKVILMSAYTGEHNISTAQSLGADLFLPKPFADIIAVIEQAERLVNDKK